MKKIKRAYIMYRLAKRRLIRKTLQTIADELYIACVKAPNEKLFWMMYDTAVQFHGFCLFTFNYQLR